MASLSDKAVALGPDAAARVFAAVNRVEAMPYPTSQPYKPRAFRGGGGTVEAIVTTAIPPCVGAVYGVGAAQPQIDNGSGTAINDPAYPNPVVVKQWLVGAPTLAIGKHIIIAARTGYWIDVTGDC